MVALIGHIEAQDANYCISLIEHRYVLLKRGATLVKIQGLKFSRKTWRKANRNNNMYFVSVLAQRKSFRPVCPTRILMRI